LNNFSDLLDVGSLAHAHKHLPSQTERNVHSEKVSGAHDGPAGAEVLCIVNFVVQKTSTGNHSKKIIDLKQNLIEKHTQGYFNANV
jgi:hypothetical protein